MLLCYATTSLATVAFYDRKKVLINLPASHKAEAIIQQKLAPLQNLVSKLTKSLKQKQKKLQVEFSKLDKKHRVEKKLEVAKLFRQLQDARKELTQQRSHLRESLYAPIEKIVDRAIADVSEMELHELVLESSQPGLLYYNKSSDITWLIIARVKDYK